MRAVNICDKAIIVSMIVLSIFSFPVYGKLERAHNEDIARIFFVDQAYYSDGSIRDSRELCALTSSVHFCLDYMKGRESSGKRLLQNIQKLPFDLDKFYDRYLNYLDLSEADSALAIDMVDSIEGLCLILKTPGSSTHEKYTHMGWLYYDNKSDSPTKVIAEPYATQWYARKLLYQKVINKIFDFGLIDEYLSEKQVELRLENYNQIHVSKLNRITRGQYTAETKSSSFAAIIYYIHILSDIAENTEGTSNTRINLSDLSSELEKHLIKVVGENKYKSNFCSMIRGAITQGKNVKSDSNTAAKFHANEILEAFHREFAYLISEEGFYKNTSLRGYLNKVQQISNN